MDNNDVISLKILCKVLKDQLMTIDQECCMYQDIKLQLMIVERKLKRVLSENNGRING